MSKSIATVTKNSLKYESFSDFEKEALQYIDTLYNTALRMSGSRSDAEDLVQETYLKAFRFKDKFQMGTNMKAWLFKILTNTFINLYRKKKTQPEAVGYDDIEPFIDQLRTQGEFLDKDTAETFMSNLLDEEIEIALRELPSEFKIVVILADLEGLSYKEIAQALNIPMGTVMSRLHRGRKVLRKKLLNYGIEHNLVGAIKNKPQLESPAPVKALTSSKVLALPKVKES